MPGIAAGVLANAVAPGTPLDRRLLLFAGATLVNPFAGLGHVYVGESTRGFYFMAGNVLATTLAGTATLAAGMAGTRNSAEALGVLGLLLVPVGISAWAAFDAYRLAEEKNASTAKSETPALP